MFKPNLETILNSFNTTITKLEDLAKRNDQTAAANEVQMSRLRSDNNLLLKEADQAKIVADRLRSLLTA